MSYIGNSPGVASQRVTTTLTATAAQTQFTTQSGYVLGYVDVYLNGAKLVNGADFEAITGTYITLFAGAAAGDIIELISYVPRGLSDGYTKAEADSKFLDVGGDTATGNLAFATATLSGNLTLNGGTANGVGYLNGSKVVTTGSALTFDGTILATPTLNLTNALGIAYGGTGATTANAALNALLPAQTGNATKYLQTDGTNTTWDAISISTADITGTLPVANGGTGATTAAGALTSLGAYAASNPSGYTTNLGTVTSVGGTGTVNGLTLTGTVSTTGNLTLGGTLSLVSPPAIGSTTPNTGAFTTLSASGAVTLSGGAANGIAYLNGSKVLTTGSTLTYDGSILGVGSAGIVSNYLLSSSASNQTNQIVSFYNNGNNYGNLAIDGSNLYFRISGTLGLTLTSTSLYTATGVNVGIGTSSLIAGSRLTLQQSATNPTALSMLNRNSTQHWKIAADAATVDDKMLAFIDGTNSTVRLVLSDTGNVGINTAAPITLKSKKTLQVLGFVKIGDDNGNGLLSLGDIASTGANVGVWRGAGGPYAGVGNYLNLGGYDGITFTTGNNSIDSQTERLRILSDGNISINSTVSRQKLHVKGRFNSDLNDDYYGLWGEGNTAASGYSFLAIGDWYTSSLYIQKQTGSSFAHIYTYSNSQHVLLQNGSGDNGTTATSGNVYIGTTTNTNSSKLVVGGTISQTVGGTQYLVVDQSDVGTAPNQIPLNQYLGSMAFQDRENVNFTGGTGALSSLDIAAVSQQLNVSAAEVLIYDTSRDSDGGAWRNRCQHTSWYNEQLNTTSRGARREFPAIAVIVGSTYGITIYDGDSPELPMWATYTSLTWDGPVTGLAALNGIIAVSICAINNIAYSGNGLVLLRFIADTQSGMHSGGYSNYYNGIDTNLLTYVRNDLTYITQRNNVREYTLPAYGLFDVAMTALPNAPIDPKTNMPTPTILVGYTGGLSVIHNNGTIGSRGSGFANDGGVFHLAFDEKNGGYWYTNGYYSETGGYPNHAGIVGYSPSVYEGGTLGNSASVNATNNVHFLQGTDTGTTSYWGTSGNHLVDSNNGHANAGRFSIVPGKAVGTQYGLTHIDPNYANGTYSMVAYTTTKYATGWLPGLAKAAFLSDTSTRCASSTAVLAEDFSAVGGWSLADGPTISGGVLTLAAQTSSRATYYSFNGIVGKTYLGVINITSNASGGTFTLDNDGVGAGDPTGNTNYASFSGTGTFYFYFTKTQSNRFRLMRTGGGPISITSFYVYETEADRSAVNKGLQVFGTLNKTSVAAGADLVAYSGFSVSNYLQQPYSTAMDFGTGDFSVVGWFKADATNTDHPMFSFGDTSNNTSFLIGFGTDALMNAGVLGTAGSFMSEAGINVTYQANVWMLVTVVRYNAKWYMYNNDKLVGSWTGNGVNENFTTKWSTNRVVTLGKRSGQASPMQDGSLALWRVAGSALTAEQVTKIYNDERVLFQENAKATLYGTSEVVTAVGHDEATKRLHVGTSSGRSVFQGLRRVDNTTTAVSVAISAVDGLVAEN